MRHPVTTYEHYRELIKRIAVGEDKVIIAEKPLILALTSGTSGASAMLLSTKDTNTEFFFQVSVQRGQISVLYKKLSLPFANSIVAVCVNVIHYDYIIGLYLSLMSLG